jgi:hypothetical protein
MNLRILYEIKGEKGMKKKRNSIVVFSLIAVFSLLLSVTVGATSASACSMDEINSLLDAVQTDLKDSITTNFADLFSPDFYHICLRSTEKPSTLLVLDYDEFLAYVQALKQGGTTYDFYRIFNRNILEYLTGDKVLVEGEFYAKSNAGVVMRLREQYTIVRESGQCVIQNRLCNVYFLQ